MNQLIIETGDTPQQGLALHLAMLGDSYEVLGVLENAKNAGWSLVRLVKALDVDVSVAFEALPIHFPGYLTEEELEYPEPMPAKAFFGHAAQYAEKFDVLSFGLPVNTIAAIEEDPELVDGIGEVIITGVLRQGEGDYAKGDRIPEEYAGLKKLMEQVPVRFVTEGLLEDGLEDSAEAYVPIKPFQPLVQDYPWEALGLYNYLFPDAFIFEKLSLTVGDGEEKGKLISSDEANKHLMTHKVNQDGFLEWVRTALKDQWWTGLR